MKKIIAFYIAFVSLSFVSFCSNATNIIYPDPSFQMMVTDGWSVIDEKSMMVFNSLSRRKGRQFYNIGIKRDKSKHVFDYPYILIQIKHDGKHPTTKELESLPQASSFLSLSKKAKSPIDKNRIYFDAFENSLFMISETTQGDGSVIYGVLLTRIIKTGRISMLLYCKPTQIWKYIDDFSFMATTMLINEAYKYKPNEIKAPPRPNTPSPFLEEK